jgi:hypothetical protein
VSVQVFRDDRGIDGCLNPRLTGDFPIWIPSQNGGKARRGDLTSGGDRTAPASAAVKLLLRDVHPAVWRRVKLANSLSIAELHRLIQLLIGWDDDHLHRFRIHGRDYGIACAGGPNFDEYAAAVRLAQFGFRPTGRFLYPTNPQILPGPR